MVFRLALAAATLPLAGGVASAAERGFPVTAFDRVESKGAFDVRIHTGAAPSVHAVGDQEMLDRLVVTVENGRLVLGMKSHNGWWPRPLHGRATVSVTVPMVRGVILTGAGDMTVDAVRTRSFEGVLGGSGDVTIGSLQAETAALTLSGSGDLKATGRVRQATLALRGSGNLRAGALAAHDAAVTLAGAGNIDAMASSAASVTLSGVGNVTVTGGARCTTARHGVGTVRCG